MEDIDGEGMQSVGESIHTERGTLKTVEQRVNTEDLIFEIEKYPPIWDSGGQEYGDKVAKRNAWHGVISRFFPDFDDRPQLEKNEIATIFMKKWKGIRTCYAREIQKKKNEKFSAEANGRRQYVYFEHLRFLETVSKKNINNSDETDDVNTSIENEEVEKIPVKRKPWPREEKISFTPFKRKPEDFKYIQVPRKKIMLSEGRKFDESDEDRLFLLSLISEMHRVPAERKLELKSDIIAAIARAQGSFVQYSGSSSYPMHSQSQLCGQSLLCPDGHLHSVYPQSINSASTSDAVPSPGTSEGSSH